MSVGILPRRVFARVSSRGLTVTSVYSIARLSKRYGYLYQRYNVFCGGRLTDALSRGLILALVVFTLSLRRICPWLLSALVMTRAPVRVAPPFGLVGETPCSFVLALSSLCLGVTLPAYGCTGSRVTNDFEGLGECPRARFGCPLLSLLRSLGVTTVALESRILHPGRESLICARKSLHILAHIASATSFISRPLSQLTLQNIIMLWTYELPFTSRFCECARFLIFHASALFLCIRLKPRARF